MFSQLLAVPDAREFWRMAKIVEDFRSVYVLLA
jgi:hypothetical protein